MEYALALARGPLFRFAFAVMVLGFMRLLILNAVNVISLLGKSQNKKVATGAIVREALRWLLPFTQVPASQRLFTVVSVAFHLCIIIVPIFLAGHIFLWERATGVRWPAMNQNLADYLTLLAILAGLLLFGRRVSTELTRSLSRAQDYLVPLIIVLTFVSGYLVVHPATSPFEYNATMLLHVGSGDLLLILLPFSKLSHALLMPVTHLASEVGWHLALDSGRRVSYALGKEGEPI